MKFTFIIWTISLILIGCGENDTPQQKKIDDICRVVKNRDKSPQKIFIGDKEGLIYSVHSNDTTIIVNYCEVTGEKTNIKEYLMIHGPHGGFTDFGCNGISNEDTFPGNIIPSQANNEYNTRLNLVYEFLSTP